MSISLTISVYDHPSTGVVPTQFSNFFHLSYCSQVSRNCCSWNPYVCCKALNCCFGVSFHMALNWSSFKTDLGLPRGSFFRLRSPEQKFSNHHRIVLSLTEPSPNTELMFILAVAALCPSLNSYKKVFAILSKIGYCSLLWRK